MIDLDPYGLLPRFAAEAAEARRRMDERIAADPTLGPDGQRWFDDPEKQAIAKAAFLHDRQALAARGSHEHAETPPESST